MKLFFSIVALVAIAQQSMAAGEVGQSATSAPSASSAVGASAATNIHPYCKNCPSSTSKPYETCTDKNNYLEKSIQYTFNDKVSNSFYIRGGYFLPEAEYTKTETCIRESMKAHGGPFRQCDQKGIGLAKKSVSKACMSSDYVQTTTDSFVAVTDCYAGYLSQPETADSNDKVRRGLFSLISYESGFHTNAVSTTGSIGIGQFTSDTVDGVNKMVLEEVMSYAKNSAKPSCKAIAKQEIKPYSIAKQNTKPYAAFLKNRCEVIDPRDGNPLKNLLYVVGIQKLNRQSIEKTLTALPTKTQLAIENATPEFREKLINMIVNWSHNTGIGGVRRPFINLVTSKRGFDLIAKEDLTSIAKEIAPMIGQYHAKNLPSCPEEASNHSTCERTRKARISEVSRFYKGIVERQGVINQNVGNSGANKCGV